MTKQVIYGALDMSRQQFHQYFKRRVSLDQLYDEAESALLLLRKAHGGLGLTKAWYQIQPPLGRHRFIREMTGRGHALRTKRSYIRTTRSGSSRFPNLIKGLVINDINLVWQSDTTYFRMGERHYYLTFIIDLYSRYVVGYHVSNSLSAQANLAALKMAIRKRKHDELQGLIFHSDGGTQYRYKPFVQLLRSHGISSSMCEVALDNAYAERLNGIIKNEYLHYHQPKDLVMLRKLTSKALKNYNCTRLHLGLHKKTSPAQFEQRLSQNQTEWKYWLQIKDGQSVNQEWKAHAGQNLNTSGIWAPKGVAQILPANVILHQPMVDPQLVLELE